MLHRKHQVFSQICWYKKRLWKRWTLWLSALIPPLNSEPDFSLQFTPKLTGSCLKPQIHRIAQCSAPRSSSKTNKRKQKKYISRYFRQKKKYLGDDSVQILHFKAPHILMNGVFRKICHLYCSKNRLRTAGVHHTHHHYILPWKNKQAWNLINLCIFILFLIQKAKYLKPSSYSLN